MAYIGTTQLTRYVGNLSWPNHNEPEVSFYLGSWINDYYPFGSGIIDVAVDKTFQDTT